MADAYTPPDGKQVGLAFRTAGENPPTSKRPALAFLSRPPYAPPAGNQAGLNFKDANYVPPTGSLVAIEFVPKDESGGSVTQYLFPGSFGEEIYGDIFVRNQRDLVGPIGITQAAYGAPAVRNGAQGITATGIAAPTMGTGHSAILWTRFTLPTGIAPLTWNATNSGSVRNWRQPVTPGGLAPIGFGTTVVKNATERQLVSPPGFTSAGYGSLVVSPRFVFPVQFLGGIAGTPQVQLPPRPVGFDSSAFGRPAVKDNHQDIGGVGFDAVLWGLPSTKRLQEFVYPPSVLESTLFGDTRPILRQRYVLPAGVDDGFISPFASVDNRNRQVLPFPLPTTAFGAAAPFNKSPNATPAGIDSLVFGTTGVGYRFRTVVPTGLQSASYGTPVVKNAAATVAPSGFAATLYGAGMASYRVRTIRQTGTDVASYGQATTWFRVRSITGVGGSDLALYGAARTDLKDRRVLEARVAGEGTYGSATAWFRVRTVAPAGIGYLIGKEFGGVTVADATKRIPIVGFTSAGFGLPDARRNEVVVSPAGFTGDVPIPFVDWSTRYLAARGFLSEEKFGELTKVFNARQYVAPVWSPDSVVLLGAVGTPWDVSNRNRTVGTFGFDMSLWGNAGTVELGGRDIHPSGDAMGTFGTAMVAPRVRYVGAEGFDAFFARYSIVANRSAVLEPSGIPRGSVGVPTMLDTRQPLDAVGGADSARLGQPFVAYRIRTVAIGQWGIEAPRLSDQTVDLYTRYVLPKAFEGQVNVPTVEEHFNKVVIFGTDQSRYGEGLVRNLTPEVQVWPTLLTEYGRAVVINRNAFVKPDGFSTIWGSATVGDRLKRVVPGGFDSLKMTSLNAVMFDAPQIPPPQKVLPIWSTNEIPPAPPSPTVTLRGMICPGINAGAIGTIFVRSNVISEVFITLNETGQMGTPKLNGPQTVLVPSVEPKQPEYTLPSGQPASTNYIGQLRVNPTTVAIDVAADPRRVIDWDQTWDATRPKWGTASVALRRRTIVQSPPQFTPQIFGVPEASLYRRTIVVTGMRLFRYGVPVIPGPNIIYPRWGRTTEEEIPGVNIDPAGYGVVTVSRPVDLNRRVYPSGFTNTYGRPWVSLFIQPITGAGGIYSQAMSTANSVHPPIKLLVQGFAPAVFGALVTGLKYRHVYPDSTYMDTVWGVDYGADGVGRPMTVRIKNTTLTATGTAMGAFGLTYTGHRVRPLLVDGIAPDAPAGVRLASRASVQVVGFDSARVGVPKRPVYGTIEPVGEDMASYGVGVMNRVMHAPYIEPGLAGAPRVQSGIRVDGLAGEFGDTVVVGESNCGSKLAVVARLGNLTTFGNPGVHR